MQLTAGLGRDLDLHHGSNVNFCDLEQGASGAVARVRVAKPAYMTHRRKCSNDKLIL